MNGYINSIAETHRTGLVNHDISTVYESSSVAGVSGAPLFEQLGEPKMLTFGNGETSVTMTGHGYTSLGTYAFSHQVWGRFHDLEKLLARDDIGFNKCFHMTW